MSDVVAISNMSDQAELGPEFGSGGLPSVHSLVTDADLRGPGGRFEITTIFTLRAGARGIHASMDLTVLN